MADILFTCSNNQFLGVSYNHNSVFFVENQIINRNLLWLLQKQNKDMFSV